MYDTTIVRYGEIFLKSEPVKREFERKLIKNIKLKLNNSNLNSNVEIIRKRHRIYIKSDRPEIIAKEVANIFGVTSTSPAIETIAEIPEIEKIAVNLAKSTIRDGETFAVRAHRTGKHTFGSKDIEIELGRQILDGINASVDLENPDKTIFIEVRDDLGFVFDKKIKGVGGLPYGTQGRVIALISTGIDSPVATWLMMKRGCEIVGVHFGDEDADITKIIKKLEEYSVYPIKLLVIPYDEILSKISAKSGKYTCVICKRTMCRIAKRISEVENAHGIVTGDNLGQVASQTLKNLEVTSVVSPIYRPLICMDKEETIKLAKKIGTYDISTGKSCPFVPSKPATRAKLDKIEEIEGKIGIDEEIDDLLEMILDKPKREIPKTYIII